ncbi:MAG: PASTA domain-containing protein [Candidatus Eisenbacteria bacterium]
MASYATGDRRGTPARRRSVRRLLIGLSFFALGSLGGVVFFQVVVMPWFVLHGAETTVPDLRDMSVDEVAPLLSGAHLEKGEVRGAFHDKVPAGRIVRHAPPPGFKVKQGRAVDLVVSRGREELCVPDLEGESLVHARFLLMQAGLEPGRVRSIHSEDVPASHVIASSPRPGTPLGGRSTVDLLVSEGPEPQRLVMPDLRGQDPDQAAAWLEAAGLRVERRFWPGARSNWPRVTRQNPLPGYPVEEGGTVQLIME